MARRIPLKRLKLVTKLLNEALIRNKKKPIKLEDGPAQNILKPFAKYILEFYQRKRIHEFDPLVLEFYNTYIADAPLKIKKAGFIPFIVQEYLSGNKDRTSIIKALNKKLPDQKVTSTLELVLSVLKQVDNYYRNYNKENINEASRSTKRVRKSKTRNFKRKLK